MKTKYTNNLVISIFLLVTLSASVHGSVYNTPYTQASPILAEAPKVIFQEGITGSSIIYKNETSAKVIVVAPTQTVSNNAMFAYGEGTINTPRYRVWNGSSWSDERSASSTSANIQWVVLKSNPKSNEKVMGTLASTGAIHVQVWNGSTWSPALALGSGVGTTNDAYRGFDIAYEQTSGRAMVVYVPSSTATDPQYIIWNGSAWSAPATIDIPTTGVIYWVKLASRPNSNQIALMTLDANSDIAAIIWNGSTWSNSRTLTTTASTATRECFAVEYEQQSGYAMFVWGEVATDLYYWRWNGSAWIGESKMLLDIPSQGGVSNWIILKADPNSNKLMLGVQDAGADLNTREWNGMAWDTATEHPEHDDAVENIRSRSFDIEYETFSGHSGHALLVWGDGATASWKHWTPTTGSSGWSTATVLTGSDDTAVVQLRRNSDGTIFAAILDDPSSATDDLVEYRWNGAAWSSRLIIEGSPSMTAQPMMEPFMVAPDLHITSAEANYDYLLKIVNKISDSWVIRLKAYSQSNISRLNNCTIYFYDGGGVSPQICILNGEYSQQFGNWYDLSGLNTIYIAMTVSAASTGTSCVYANLEILVPGTSIYNFMIITFEIS